MLRSQLSGVFGYSARPQGSLALLRFVYLEHVFVFLLTSNFTGIWKIIKGWLDPVVAGKVHFTYNANDLEKFIPRDRIMKELEGDENWEYQYLEPHPDENKAMEDTAKRDALLAERQELAKEIQDATISWLSASADQNKEAIIVAEEKRNYLINKLRHHYWDLDPYVRARSLYDRLNVIQGGGKIQFYPGPS